MSASEKKGPEAMPNDLARLLNRDVSDLSSQRFPGVKFLYRVFDSETGELVGESSESTPTESSPEDDELMRELAEARAAFETKEAAEPSVVEDAPATQATPVPEPPASPGLSATVMTALSARETPESPTLLEAEEELPQPRSETPSQPDSPQPTIVPAVVPAPPGTADVGATAMVPTLAAKAAKPKPPAAEAVSHGRAPAASAPATSQGQKPIALELSSSAPEPEAPDAPKPPAPPAAIEPPGRYQAAHLSLASASKRTVPPSRSRAPGASPRKATTAREALSPLRGEARPPSAEHPAGSVGAVLQRLFLGIESKAPSAESAGSLVRNLFDTARTR